MRWDYSENDGMELAEIAKELGITADGVHKIQKKAMAKLKRIVEEKGLKAEDFYDTQKQKPPVF